MTLLPCAYGRVMTPTNYFLLDIAFSDFVWYTFGVVGCRFA